MIIMSDFSSSETEDEGDDDPHGLLSDWDNWMNTSYNSTCILL